MRISDWSSDVCSSDLIATVVLALGPQWGLAYDELIPYATPCFVMFGLGAVPSGWLADKWSREGMMLVFFLGIGAASILAGFAETPLQLGACLLLEIGRASCRERVCQKG